ncbi:MAG: tetratricopeptide repeat protein [Alphaproteobacteria bacterium]
MGDIFREIDEELRQDRNEKLWKTYGKYVIGAVVAIIVAYGSVRGWDQYRTKQRQNDSARFQAAATFEAAGKKSEAAAVFASLADKGTDGYQTLARFRQAALRAKGGDAAGAIAVYDRLAADDGLSVALREAAVVFAVMQGIDQSGIDAAALGSRLSPLIRDDGPWRHSARELAGLLALNQGDVTAARKSFTALVDDISAPAGMRARATQVLAVIGG